MILLMICIKKVKSLKNTMNKILEKYCIIEFDSSVCTLYYIPNKQGIRFAYNKAANIVERRISSTVFVFHNFTNKKKLESFFKSFDIRKRLE